MTQNNTKRSKLLLFDLDGTLVNVLDAHHQGVKKALHDVYGIEAFNYDTSMAGKPQGEFIREMCRMQGIPEAVIQERYPLALQTLSETTIAALPADAGSAVLPGVPELLKELSVRGVNCTLVTGSLRKTATAILERTGLIDYFPLLVCGDEGTIRADLVRKAVDCSVEQYRLKTPLDIIAIGDSPNDITSARAAGIRVVSVATGGHTESELAAAHPDGILRGFSDLSAALAVLLAE